MTAFRVFLGVIFVAVGVYTIPVVLNHGLILFAVFFGDIAEMGWPGQFNFDFLGFLAMSAFFVAWRHQFSVGGLGLAVLAFFFGAPFLTAYLIVVSVQTKGDVAAMLLGEARAASLTGRVD